MSPSLSEHEQREGSRFNSPASSPTPYSDLSTRGKTRQEYTTGWDNN